MWYGLKVASGSSSDSDGMGKSGRPGLGGEGLGKDWAPAKDSESFRNGKRNLLDLGLVVRNGKRNLLDLGLTTKL